MQSGPKQGTVLATWRVVSTKPQAHGVQADQVLHVSHVGTQALGSVWHATSRNGSWSITEALATICVGLFAVANNKSASVQLIVPSPIQALLTMSLLQDLDVANMGVSTAPTRPRHGSHPRVFVVSLPQDEDSAGNDYVEMVQEILKHDMRLDMDQVISVGEAPRLGKREDAPRTNSGRQAPEALRLGRFGDRGDLIQRLLHLSSTAQQQLLPLRSTQDVDNIPILMGRSNWSDEKVVCLCGPDLPPIMFSFAHVLSNEADVLTNCQQLFGGGAATSKSLRGMRDFADEALLCTSGQWLLVEPQLGRGGPHRNATLLMRAASTTLFVIRLALGSLDGAIAVEVPRPEDSALEETDQAPLGQEDAQPKETVQVTPSSHLHTRKAEQDDKKHRYHCYSDIHEKKLREVVGRLTPGEIDILFAGLEAQETK